VLFIFVPNSSKYFSAELFPYPHVLLVSKTYPHVDLFLIQRVLTVSNAHCEDDFYYNVRYLKSVACALVIKNQNWSRSTVICSDVFMKFLFSLKDISYIDIFEKNYTIARCSIKLFHTNTCLFYINTELNACGIYIYILNIYKKIKYNKIIKKVKKH